MRRLVWVLVLAGGTVLASPLSPASAAPDPVTCSGYPEPRTYLEDQSWLSPEIGPATHPGTGKQGYITVGTCFPLYQHFGATGTISFDLTVRLHNIPGVVNYINVDARGDYKLQATPNIAWRCPATDCERSFHADFPLEKLNYSGLHAIQLEVYTHNENDKYQYTLPLFPLYLDNGKPLPPKGSVTEDTSSTAAQHGVAGDSWYAAENPHGKHTAAAIKQADFPWDPATGESIVKTGVWTPTVFVEKDAGFAYIDSSLRANPPSKGMVVYEANQTFSPGQYHTLRIDTTKLADGPHNLLIGSCNTGMVSTVHCGALSFNFVVGNHPSSSSPGGPDTTKPVISKLALSAKHFRAARRGPSAVATRTRVGVTVSYRLSEPATVKFRVQRAAAGRRAHGRCGKAKGAPRHAKRCTRWVTVRGGFSQRGKAGANKLKFKGRLRGHRERPGRYRLGAVATDAAGNHSTPRTARFRIVRR